MSKNKQTKNKSEVKKYDTLQIEDLGKEETFNKYGFFLDFKNAIGPGSYGTYHIPILPKDFAKSYKLNLGFFDGTPFCPGKGDENEDNKNNSSSINSYVKLLPKELCKITEEEKNTESMKLLFNRIAALENFKNLCVNQLLGTQYLKEGETLDTHGDKIPAEHYEDIGKMCSAAGIKEHDPEKYVESPVKYENYTKESVQAANLSVKLIGTPNKTTIPKLVLKLLIKNYTGKESKEAKKLEEQKQGLALTNTFMGNDKESNIFIREEGKQIQTTIWNCLVPKTPKKVINWQEFQNLVYYESGSSKAGTMPYFALKYAATTYLPTLVFNKNTAKLQFKTTEIKVWMKTPINFSRTLTDTEIANDEQSFEKYLKATMSDEEAKNLIKQRQENKMIQESDSQNSHHNTDFVDNDDNDDDDEVDNHPPPSDLPTTDLTESIQNSVKRVNPPDTTISDETPSIEQKKRKLNDMSPPPPTNPPTTKNLSLKTLDELKTTKNYQNSVKRVNPPETTISDETPSREQKKRKLNSNNNSQQ